ncbi:MAG: NAD(P)-dependent oxidoreductase [Gemmataceae bacterium]
MAARCVLLTGATGKVGRHFLARFLADQRFASWSVRALCHQRGLPELPRVEVLRGSISDRAVARQAMSGVTHVVHLATCKETPEEIMDVAVKGMFWLLEEARVSPSLARFVLVGGDAAVGHFVYPHPVPVTEDQRHTAYPGCYALSKVLEEVMLEQFGIQYNLDVCCLRAPWIMEKDDFKYQLSFGEDVFGAPRWGELVGPQRAREYQERGTVPVLLDAEGQPVLRNFVHVDDLAGALLLALEHPRARRQTFNICMDEPVNYQAVADHLARTRGVDSVGIRTAFHSTWLDNSRARFLLGWRPKYDLARLIDEAFAYQRNDDDPRRIWYPG